MQRRTNYRASFFVQIKMPTITNSTREEVILMNQRQLKYFLSVYEHRSISRAAEEMFISPQGVSKTLASLEAELGVSLFEHKSNRIVPTDAAARLSIHARNILTELSFVSDKLFEEPQAKKELPVYCSYDVPQLISSSFISSFADKYPDVVIKLREYPDSDIFEALEKHRVALAIVPGPVDISKFNCEFLYTEPFCLVINKKQPLACYNEISIEQLQDVPIAIKDLNTPGSIIQYDEFQKHNVTPNIILETTDAHLIHKMAEDNIAVGMSLMYLARKIKSDNISVVPFREKWLSKSLYIVSNKGDEPGYISDAFKTEIIDYFHRQSPL